MSKTFKFYGVDNNCYKLDDTVWEAIEDPSDGYRSYLGSIESRLSSDRLIFFDEPIAEVTVRKYNEGTYVGYVLEDVKDGHIWLFIGTDHRDGYYPCFRFEYEPKNPHHYHEDGTPKSEWEIFILDEGQDEVQP